MNIVKNQIKIPKIVYVLTIDEEERKVLNEAMDFWLEDYNINEQHEDDDGLAIGREMNEKIQKAQGFNPVPVKEV
jgi:hypothetical protein